MVAPIGLLNRGHVAIDGRIVILVANHHATAFRLPNDPPLRSRESAKELLFGCGQIQDKRAPKRAGPEASRFERGLNLVGIQSQEQVVFALLQETGGHGLHGARRHRRVGGKRELRPMGHPRSQTASSEDPGEHSGDGSVLFRQDGQRFVAGVKRLKEVLG